MSDETELAELQERIAYLQQTLQAIGGGGVDAVVVAGPDGEQQLYTLTSADRPYRVIVEHMGEGAITVSESGVILYANPQVADFLGVDRDTMVGRDLTSYVSLDQQPALVALLVGSPDAESSTRRGELSLHKPDGTAVPFLVAATDLDIEDVLVRCLVLTDLTMQKLVEQQVAAEAARTQRHEVAREVNDTLVQGLVAAEMALDLGQLDFARSLVARTSSHARHWIGELGGGDQLEPGVALRSGPARPDAETP
jgi:PAS domain S-box-containing protein